MPAIKGRHLGGVREADLLLIDTTRADVSITKHGLVVKAPNDATKFFRGDAAWATLDGLTFKAADGLVGTPGITFANEPDCGIYKAGTNDIAFVTNGTRALEIDSTQFIDSPTQPRCVVYNSTTQSINSGVATAITFDSETIDVGGLHSTGALTSRVTCPTGGDGFYMIRGSVFFAANATGFRELILQKNGVTSLRVTSKPVTAAADNDAFEVSWFGDMVATDYFEMFALQNSGGNLNVGSATRSNACELVMVKLW